MGFFSKFLYRLPYIKEIIKYNLKIASTMLSSISHNFVHISFLSCFSTAPVSRMDIDITYTVCLNICTYFNMMKTHLNSRGDNYCLHKRFLYFQCIVYGLLHIVSSLNKENRLAVFIC